MKVLWINPSFLDYRIPVYKELNILFDKNFYILYSKNRVPDRVFKKTESLLGPNSISLDNEKQIFFGRKGDFSNEGVLVSFQKGLVNKIFKVNADIIICEGFFQWTPYAIIFSFFKRKPLWIAYERTSHTERNCPKWRLFYRKFINLFVKGYLVNGQLTEDYLRQIGVKKRIIQKGCMSADSEGLAIKVSNVCENEVNIIKLRLNINNGIVYLFVGQLIERKGLSYLIEAWKDFIVKFPEANLLIVGDGDQRTELESNCSSFPSIHFIGDVDYEQIYLYYAISNVFILPTLEDNWSLVIPEAMACGLPVATSIYNGCYPELIQKDLNGLIFDPFNKDSIFSTLEYFYKSKDNLSEMGEYSRKIAANFTSSIVANRIYNTILKSNLN